MFDINSAAINFRGAGRKNLFLQFSIYRILIDDLRCHNLVGDGLVR